MHNSKVVELAENYTRQKSRLDPSRSTYRGRGAENSGAGPTRPDRAQNVRNGAREILRPLAKEFSKSDHVYYQKVTLLTDKIPIFPF